MRKRLSAVSAILASAKQSDLSLRRFGIQALGDCDDGAARPLLEAMAKEPDKYVADAAKDALRRIAEH